MRNNNFNDLRKKEITFKTTLYYYNYEKKTIHNRNNKYDIAN